MIVVIADEAHRNLSSSSCAVPPVVRIGHRRRLRAGADNSGNVMAGRPRSVELARQPGGFGHFIFILRGHSGGATHRLQPERAFEGGDLLGAVHAVDYET
jgi:hypothetical protein